MTLKADDGTPLISKEPIVLDSNGKPIFPFQSTEKNNSFLKKDYVKAIKISILILSLCVIAIATLFFFGSIFFITMIIWLTFLFFEKIKNKKI